MPKVKSSKIKNFWDTETLKKKFWGSKKTDRFSFEKPEDEYIEVEFY
ncbi:MAG: hypothetical protein V1855_01470 [bacterium]